MTNVLFAVDAISSDDAWAVGYFDPEPVMSQPLIEHWDGTSWRVVRSPQPPGDSNLLHDVSGVSSREVWAVGYIRTERWGIQPLIEHWDGARWRVIRPPAPRPPNTVLYGVAAASASDVWAVGDFTLYPDQGSYSAHWNGKSCSSRTV